MIENLSDLTIAVLVEETVNLGDEFGFELANLSDGQQPIEDQAAGSSP